MEIAYFTSCQFFETLHHRFLAVPRKLSFIIQGSLTWDPTTCWVSIKQFLVLLAPPLPKSQNQTSKAKRVTTIRISCMIAEIPSPASWFYPSLRSNYMVSFSYSSIPNAPSPSCVNNHKSSNHMVSCSCSSISKCLTLSIMRLSLSFSVGSLSRLPCIAVMKYANLRANTTISRCNEKIIDDENNHMIATLAVMDDRGARSCKMTRK